MTVKNVKCRDIFNFQFYIVILIFDFLIFNLSIAFSPLLR